jgi:YHS domain-containing protein
MSTTAAEAAAEAEVVDPVCGMTVLPSEAAGSVEYKGQTYFFFATSCLERFRESPEAFLFPAPDGSAVPSSSDTGEYTCPMDPEVRQIGPGACPICGMALTDNHDWWTSAKYADLHLDLRRPVTANLYSRRIVYWRPWSFARVSQSS